MRREEKRMRKVFSRKLSGGAVFFLEDWSGLVSEVSAAARIYICDRGLPRNSLEESI